MPANFPERAPIRRYRWLYRFVYLSENMRLNAVPPASALTPTDAVARWIMPNIKRLQSNPIRSPARRQPQRHPERFRRSGGAQSYCQASTIGGTQPVKIFRLRHASEILANRASCVALLLPLSRLVVVRKLCHYLDECRQCMAVYAYTPNCPCCFSQYWPGLRQIAGTVFARAICRRRLFQDAANSSSVALTVLRTPVKSDCQSIACFATNPNAAVAGSAGSANGTRPTCRTPADDSAVQPFAGVADGSIESPQRGQVGVER